MVVSDRLRWFASTRAGLPFFLAALSFLAYWPALNNGFISDDYIILQRATTLKDQPFYLFGIPPEGFRTTSYIAFAALKALFGYHSGIFYLFAILLHWVNSYLLFRLLSSITKSPSVAALASVLFATFQNPQESTMWLSGINESLLGIGVLGTLLLWRKDWYIGSALLYLLALLSKESAVILLVLVPLADFWAEKKVRFRRQYFYLFLPTALFGAFFIATFSHNALAGHGLYGLRLHALIVLAVSLHRLSLPWLYLAVVFVVSSGKKCPDSNVAAGLVWMTLTMLPYIFLVYMNHVPSRCEHLASMGLAAALAFLLKALDLPALRKLFIVCFIAWNVGYLWIVKDAQYERRAAPSRQLIEEMKRRHPGPLRIVDYPENPWIAKETTRLVPGWQPDMIKPWPAEYAPPDCPKLRWNSQALTYEEVSR